MVNEGIREMRRRDEKMEKLAEENARIYICGKPV